MSSFMNKMMDENAPMMQRPKQDMVPEAMAPSPMRAPAEPDEAGEAQENELAEGGSLYTPTGSTFGDPEAEGRTVGMSDSGLSGGDMGGMGAQEEQTPRQVRDHYLGLMTREHEASDEYQGKVAAENSEGALNTKRQRYGTTY